MLITVMQKTIKPKQQQQQNALFDFNVCNKLKFGLMASIESSLFPTMH